MKKGLILFIMVSVSVILLLGSLYVRDLISEDGPCVSPDPIEPDPLPDPDPSPDPDPIPLPANVSIIGKYIGLATAGHWFFLEIKVNNTGDLSAYNTTIIVNVNFTTKYEEATIYLINDMGVLRDATARGSITIPIIANGTSEHFIALELLLGSKWIYSPISYISQPHGGYSFHILSDNIIIE